MPTISTFTYHDKQRVAVELGPGRGGLFTTQLYPERAPRTFKPGKMMQSERVTGLRYLYWFFRFKVGI
jgi:hypothetical protein